MTTRVLTGAGIGAAVGLVLLVAAGAVLGYTEGLTSAGLPPGWAAAVKTAARAALILWWLAAGVGAVGGGLAAFASGLVARPRSRAGRAASG